MMLAFLFFGMQHNKVYDTEEFYKRLHIFTKNKKTIDCHNPGNHSITSTVLHSCLIMYTLVLQQGALSGLFGNERHVLTFFIFKSSGPESDVTFEEFRKLFLLTNPQV